MEIESLFDNIKKEHLVKAIQEIDEKGISNGEHSTTYDVIYNNKRYPPKLVVSLANKYAKGEIIPRDIFLGGNDTPAFQLLKNNGFEIEEKDFVKNQITKFLAQSKTSSLKHKEYYKKYRGLKTKASFGAGVQSRIPWMAFFSPPNKVSEGIYPVLLLFKEINKLILTYGVSEQNEPLYKWPLQNDELLLNDWFENNYNKKPERYGASFIKAVYDLETPLDFQKITQDLNTVIDIYKETVDSKENKDIYSWVDTHKEIVKFLESKENNQIELIEILKSAGATVFNDKDIDDKIIDLAEIDPFTFFCYIYKYGNEKRLEILQKLAKIIKVDIPKGDFGVPSSNAQRVWLFPNKKLRNNNEIARLWDFFKSAIKNEISDSQFADILEIHNTGLTKISEALFYVDPINFFPINGPTKPFLKEVLGINPYFKTYSEYEEILNLIKLKTDKPFYQLSHEAWEWNNKVNNELDENNFEKSINRFSENDLIFYFNHLDKIVSHLGLKKDDPRVVFSCNGKYLNLNIGQRMSWRLDSKKEKKYHIMLDEKVNAKASPFDGNLTHFYYIFDDHSELQNIRLSSLRACKAELERTNLSSYRQHNDEDFEQAVFDKEFRAQYIKIDKMNNNDPFDLKLLYKCISDSGLHYKNGLITRFASSLLTKPFIILTGLSGSGKTKLAQAFVQWICQDISQFCIIPVGADWTNREPLLGYPNALEPDEYVKPDSGVLDLIIRANEYLDVPHFLILDEMNLSHVERYFADFLSVMESNEEIPLYAEGTVNNGVPSKLVLPANLFIIGTVNIDETTNMFSPKVLDRANTIEFRVTADEMEGFLDNIKEINMEALNKKGARMAISFLQLAKNKSFTTKDKEEINKTLVQFFGELKKTGAEFGYRSATEILRLMNQLSVLDDSLSTNEKIDIAIIQKLLPKLHGSRRKLCPVLESLGSFCLKKEMKMGQDVFENEDFDFQGENVLYPLSLEKITRMYKGAIDNGFTSFAEA